MNGRLSSYNISEIPFDADVTDAIKPGSDNLLAVRITNPGGSFSWSDFGTDKWGAYDIPNAKAFGGMSGGVTLAIRGAVAVDDLYVANNPDPHQVTLNVHIVSGGPAYKGPLNLSIQREGNTVWSGTADVDVPAGGETTVSQQVTVPSAELWDLDHPNLYRAVAGISSIPHSTRATDFGFRWFNAEGDRHTTLDTADMQRGSNVSGTDDPGLYENNAVAKDGDIDWYENLAPGNATVELFFTETFFDRPKARVFDLAFNGKVVEHEFDIFSAAGGKNKAVVKQYTVPCSDGKLVFSIPRVESDQPELAAIRITDAAGKIIREVFRSKDYTSPSGEVWKAANPPGFDWKNMIPKALDKVSGGARLVIMGGDFRDVQGAAQVLNEAKVATFSGLSGYDDTAWLGHWYFAKKHWLLDGLPSDCVLDWQYQAGGPGNGLKIDADGMEGVIGYGRNPGIGLGFGEVVIPYGKGQIVLIALSGLYAAFAEDNPKGFAPPTATRMVYNALRH